MTFQGMLEAIMWAVAAGILSHREAFHLLTQASSPPDDEQDDRPTPPMFPAWPAKPKRPGARCRKCGEYNEYAEPDGHWDMGTFVCYRCKTGASTR